MSELPAIDGAAWSDYPCDTRAYRRVWGRFFYRTFGLWSLHYCNNSRCWEPYHIYMGTASDNLRDAYAAGLIPPQTGKPLSEAHRAAISQTLRGRPLSEATKAAMSKSRLGKLKSEAHRAALSRAHRRKA